MRTTAVWHEPQREATAPIKSDESNFLKPFTAEKSVMKKAMEMVNELERQLQDNTEPTDPAISAKSNIRLTILVSLPKVT